MGAHAHTVETAEEDVVIDVPFRVFNERHYRNLAAILTAEGIEWEMCNYAASYSDVDDGTVFFRYCNWLVGSFSLPYLPLSGLFSASSWTVASDFAKWISRAKSELDAGDLEGLTMKEYLDLRGYSDVFQDSVFFPIMAIIMTCDMDTMRQYPADMVVGAFTNGRGRGVKRALGGTDRIVEALSADFAAVHTSSSVSKIYPGESPRVVVKLAGSDQETTLEYDHVIVATQPEHVLSLLDSAPPSLVSALSSWGSESSDVVVHTDEGLMPADPAAWSPINVLLDRNDTSRPMATMWLNRLHPALANHPVNIFQTWHPLSDPDPATVITTSTFTRPVMGPNAAEAAADLDAAQGTGNVWLAGSYARYGLPLLENGVTSALDVVSRIGVPLPEYVEITPPYGAAKRLQSGGRGWGAWLLRTAVLVSGAAAVTVVGVRWGRGLGLVPGDWRKPLR